MFGRGITNHAILDWPAYPLSPHQVAASAPTPDRSTNPAKGCRKAKKGLTNLGPLQKHQTSCARRSISMLPFFARSKALSTEKADR